MGINIFFMEWNEGLTSVYILCSLLLDLDPSRRKQHTCFPLLSCVLRNSSLGTTQDSLSAQVLWGSGRCFGSDHHKCTCLQDRQRIHALVTYTVLASLNGCAGRKRSHSEARTFPRSLLLPYSVYLDSLLASPCSGFAFATQFSCPGSPFSQNRSWSFGFRVYREPDSVTLGVVTELQHAFPSGEQRTGLWVTGVTPFTISPQGQLT